MAELSIIAGYAGSRDSYENLIPFLEPLWLRPGVRIGYSDLLSSGETVGDLHRWWDGRPAESYWLEVTRRNDIGANLKAPRTDEQGNDFWGYSLINEIRDGDQVYHYDGKKQAIIARSIATGVVWGDEVVWAARGLSARSAKITPHPRPGWYLGLEKFERLEPAITLERIREEASALRSMVMSLTEDVGRPLYFPFELGKRQVRPMQGYLFKLPSAFLDLFGVGRSQETHRATPSSLAELGVKYRPADDVTAIRESDPFSVDPGLVERGVRGHATTQNALAEHLHSNGIEPRSPRADEPNFDIAWSDGGRVFVAEVKSITPNNEEKQLRLGLGQVLRYAHQLSAVDRAVPVLVAERRPSDASWEDLCARVGVVLAWPEVFAKRFIRRTAAAN